MHRFSHCSHNQAEQLRKIIHSLSEVKGIESILGLQFENLLLANRQLIQKKLEIPDHQLISSAPYVQRKTALNKGGCQIDLLIHSDLDVFYLCEFKCQKIIHKQVVRDVLKKMNVFQLPKRSSLKPVLVYQGELHPGDIEALNAFFYRVIPFESLFGE